MSNACLALTLVLTVVGCHGASDGSPSLEKNVSGGRFGIPVQGLQMSAEPLREVVPPEGPLWVELTVQNVADSVARFRPMFNIGGWLRADIVGPGGIPVPNTASIDPPNAWEVTLRPGESVTDTTDLRCDVPSQTRDGCIAPYDLSGTGEYHVSLRFTLPCYGRECENNMTVEAEPFTVRVAETGG